MSVQGPHHDYIERHSSLKQDKQLARGLELSSLVVKSEITPTMACAYAASYASKIFKKQDGKENRLMKFRNPQYAGNMLMKAAFRKAIGEQRIQNIIDAYKPLMELSKNGRYTHILTDREMYIAKDDIKDEEGNLVFKKGEEILKDEEGNLVFKKGEEILVFKKAEEILKDEEGNVFFKKEEEILKDEEGNLVFKKEEEILNNYSDTNVVFYPKGAVSPEYSVKVNEIRDGITQAIKNNVPPEAYAMLKTLCEDHCDPELGQNQGVKNDISTLLIFNLVNRIITETLREGGDKKKEMAFVLGAKIYQEVGAGKAKTRQVNELHSFVQDKIDNSEAYTEEQKQKASQVMGQVLDAGCVIESTRQFNKRMTALKDSLPPEQRKEFGVDKMLSTVSKYRDFKEQITKLHDPTKMSPKEIDAVFDKYMEFAGLTNLQKLKIRLNQMGQDLKEKLSRISFPKITKRRKFKGFKLFKKSSKIKVSAIESVNISQGSTRQERVDRWRDESFNTKTKLFGKNELQVGFLPRVIDYAKEHPESGVMHKVNVIMAVERLKKAVGGGSHGLISETSVVEALLNLKEQFPEFADCSNQEVLEKALELGEAYKREIEANSAITTHQYSGNHDFANTLTQFVMNVDPKDTQRSDLTNTQVKHFGELFQQEMDTRMTWKGVDPFDSADHMQKILEHSLGEKSSENIEFLMKVKQLEALELQEPRNEKAIRETQEEILEYYKKPVESNIPNKDMFSGPVEKVKSINLSGRVRGKIERLGLDPNDASTVTAARLERAVKEIKTLVKTDTVGRLKNEENSKKPETISPEVTQYMRDIKTVKENQSKKSSVLSQEPTEVSIDQQKEPVDLKGRLMEQLSQRQDVDHDFEKGRPETLGSTPGVLHSHERSKIALPEPGTPQGPTQEIDELKKPKNRS